MIGQKNLFTAIGELISSDITITELAMKYGYASSDSFTKAFSRLHGFTPSAVRKEKAMVKKK